MNKTKELVTPFPVRSNAGLAGTPHGVEVTVIEFGRKRIAWPVYGGWRTMRKGRVCWCHPEALYAC